MDDYGFSFCVVVPTYNNRNTVADVINEIKRYSENVIVVNDGSTDDTSEILKSIEGIESIEYRPNAGKGKALTVGLRAAAAAGFDYAVTIDSDGQHFPSDIPQLSATAARNPGALIVGTRNIRHENMPGKNTFANKFSNFWFRVETGVKLSDTQSGFRVYPLGTIKRMRFFTTGYEFELEALVRCAWQGVPIVQVPVNVYYAPEGERVSHFRPLRDFVRIGVLNTVLVLVALFWIKPLGLFKNLTGKNIKAFIIRHISDSEQSNGTITLSVMLGVFTGIIPAWGYQMIIAFGLAHVFRLNKALAVVASNISIPPMIPLILFASFATGAVITGNDPNISFGDISFASVKQNIFQYLVGSAALAAMCSIMAGSITFALLKIFRKRERTK